MHASQATNIILDVLKYQKKHDRLILKRSAIDKMAGVLRDNGLLPGGPRGVHAPHVDPDHVANILIAVLGCESPGDAAEVVLTYAKLKSEDGETFREFLARAVSTPLFAETIERISVCRTFARTSAIVKVNDEIKTLTFAGEAPTTGGLFTVDASLSGGFLSQLSVEFSDPRLRFLAVSDEPARGGWVADNPEQHAEYKARLAAHREGSSDE